MAPRSHFQPFLLLFLLFPSRFTHYLTIRARSDCLIGSFVTSRATYRCEIIIADTFRARNLICIPPASRRFLTLLLSYRLDAVRCRATPGDGVFLGKYEFVSLPQTAVVCMQRRNAEPSRVFSRMQSLPFTRAARQRVSSLGVLN